MLLGDGVLMPWRRRLAAAMAAGVGVVVLSSCTAPYPDVSFFGNGAGVRTAPSLWCATNTAEGRLDCAVSRADDQAPTLDLAAGQGVSINVPAAVGNAPWVVLFRYVDAAGKVQEARGQVFAGGQTQQYLLQPPELTDQLSRVEVQSGLTPMGTDSGKGVDYAALRTWVLIVTPTA